MNLPTAQNDGCLLTDATTFPGGDQELNIDVVKHIWIGLILPIALLSCQHVKRKIWQGSDVVAPIEERGTPLIAARRNVLLVLVLVVVSSLLVPYCLCAGFVGAPRLEIRPQKV